MSLDTTNVAQLKVISFITIPAVSVYLSQVGVNLKLLNGVGYMMLIDIIMAIIMWLRVDPSKLKSSVLKQGLTEKIASLIPAAVIFIILISFDKNMSALLNGYLSILLLAEAYSAISNAHNAYVKEVKEEYDAVSAVLKSLKTKIFKLLQAAVQSLGVKEEKENKNK
jgi:hypothetical protein